MKFETALFFNMLCSNVEFSIQGVGFPFSSHAFLWVMLVTSLIQFFILKLIQTRHVDTAVLWLLPIISVQKAGLAIICLIQAHKTTTEEKGQEERHLSLQTDLVPEIVKHIKKAIKRSKVKSKIRKVDGLVAEFGRPGHHQQFCSLITASYSVKINGKLQASCLFRKWEALLLLCPCIYILFIVRLPVDRQEAKNY